MSKVTSFPDSPEAVVWDKFKTVLTSDAVLKAGVKDWRVLDGRGHDAEDWPPPEPAGLPALRVTPQLGVSQWASESQHEVRLPIAFDMAVPGTEAADLMNFWGAIRSAVFPQDPTRRDYVNAQLDYATLRAEVKGTAMEPVPTEGGEILLCSAVIVITMYVNT